MALSRAFASSPTQITIPHSSSFLSYDSLKKSARHLSLNWTPTFSSSKTSVNSMFRNPPKLLKYCSVFWLIETRRPPRWNEEEDGVRRYPLVSSIEMATCEDQPCMVAVHKSDPHNIGKTKMSCALLTSSEKESCPALHREHAILHELFQSDFNAYRSNHKEYCNL